MKTIYTFEVDTNNAAADVATLLSAFACTVAPATVRNQGRIGSAVEFGAPRNWAISARGPRAEFDRATWITEAVKVEAELLKLAAILRLEVSGFMAWVEDDAGDLANGSVY